MMFNYVMIGLIIVFAIGGIYLVVKYPAKVKEWLIYACACAEKSLGSGTGKLKLRYVYDLFVDKFPLIGKLVSFETFGKWVDEALVELNKMIINSVDIEDYIQD